MQNKAMTVTKIVLTVISTFLFVGLCYAAGGTDLMKEPAKNLMATVVGTGFDLLMLGEVGAGVYYFTQQRKTVALVGIPIIMAITQWGKVTFGG